jgi:O-acetyl-ADP-ribose deacetylase (regulator of RNase III)
MGDNRPAGMSAKDETEWLQKRIAEGGVSKSIVRSSDRAMRFDREFKFFPMWGSAQFLLELIEKLGDPDLAADAHRYLDHGMRLRQVLARGGLAPAAVAARVMRIDERMRLEDKRAVNVPSEPVRVWSAQGPSQGHQLHVIYGDLASRALLAFPLGEGRRAVISADDTFLSAGGGAALALLDRAGKAPLLNELGKFRSASKGELAGQTDVVVTSAFNLPVNYIFHAATAALRPDGSSNTTAEDVRATMASALRMARALSVQILFAPLIGAGTEAVPPEQSLAAILAAFADFVGGATDDAFGLVIVIRQEADLARKDVGRMLEAKLASLTLTPASAPAA